MQSHIPGPLGEELRRQDVVREFIEAALDSDPDEVEEHHPGQSRLIYASHASTWYNRERVGDYLWGVPVTPFLSLTKTPEARAKKTERAARTIWEAAVGVVRVGEQIIAHSDTCIRKEAAQIHQGETPRQPLEALLDTEKLRSWAEPWQRVLMFFVRTQASDNCQGPPYQFTAQQQSAWDRLCQTANDSPIEPMHSDPDASVFRLNSLQLACLQFCVELLNQHYHDSAFECALVCALAALGYDQDGWLPLNSYVDILSKAVRIGQSLVVQHTLLLGSDSEDLFEDMQCKKDGDWTGEVLCEIPSISDRTRATRSDLLSSWLRTTIVVGTKSPMDWMLSIAFEI